MSVLIWFKPFDTLIVFLKEFFERVNFEKKSADNNNSMRNYSAYIKALVFDFKSATCHRSGESKYYECKIVIIFLPISLNIHFWCSKEPSNCYTADSQPIKMA